MHQVVSESAIPVKPSGARPRLDSVDLLRGCIMIFMALDHVRDLFHDDSMRIDPTDMAHTYPALFFTRWITHFCAPLFVFLAGTGAFLSLGRGRSKPELSYFLVTRGLWLIVLEYTLVPFGWTFGFAPNFLGGQVIWAIGCSMLVLAALIYLPRWALITFAVVTIVGHNLLDGIKPETFGSFAWLWIVLHVQRGFEFHGFHFFSVYPLIPWIGVMAAGYAFGGILKKDRAERRRSLVSLGASLCLAFVLLRALNVYGDPHPWRTQRDGIYTLLSFLNCTKYPPSLLYLLMTIGPGVLAIWLFDRDRSKFAQPLIVFGRVPLFYYLLHVPLAHLLAIAFAYVKYGYAGFIVHGPPWFQENPHFPAEYGYNLAATYAIWLLVIALLYPLCRWFADFKQRRREAWLSYF